MSVRETDRNEDKYVGIGFPLGFTTAGLFHQTKSVLEQAKSNMRNVLLTHKGERVGQPEFGSNLLSILFTEDISILSDRIEQEIRSSIERQLPYILINNIFLTGMDESSPNQVNVQIEFSVSLEPDIFDTLLLEFNESQNF